MSGACSSRSSRNVHYLSGEAVRSEKGSALGVAAYVFSFYNTPSSASMTGIKPLEVNPLESRRLSFRSDRTIDVKVQDLTMKVCEITISTSDHRESMCAQVKEVLLSPIRL